MLNEAVLIQTLKLITMGQDSTLMGALGNSWHEFRYQCCLEASGQCCICPPPFWWKNVVLMSISCGDVAIKVRSKKVQMH